MRRGFVLLVCLLPLVMTMPDVSHSQGLDSGRGGDLPAVTVTGRLTVVQGDDFAHDRGELMHFVEDETSGRRFRLRFEKRPPGHLRSGAVVRARGRATGDELLLEAAGEEGTGVETLSPALETVAGEQRTLVLVTDFLDASVSCSVEEIRDRMFSDLNDESVDDFYQEASFGATWLSGEVVGPYLIGVRSTDSCSSGTWADAADALAEANGVDVASFDRSVYVMPRSNGCGFAGLGQVGGLPSRAWIFRCGQADIFAHELGHNLGMGHAGTPTSEYGDTSDVMGAGGWGLRLMNAPHKEQVGWVDPSKIASVEASGLYDLAPLELEAWQARAPQMLKIFLPSTGEYYYLSYRKPLGFDANLAYTYLSRLTVHRHPGDGSARRTELLRTLADGESFVDTTNGVTISQESQEPDLVTVHVQFDDTCWSDVPALDLSPASQSGEPGTTVDYLLQLTNTDSSVCSESVFALRSVLPQGWSGAIWPETLSLLPGQVGPAVLSVTSPAGALEGDYFLGAEVSDPVDPRHHTSAGASYTVRPDCSCGVPAVRIVPEIQEAGAGVTLTYQVSVTNTDGPGCGNSTFSFDPAIPPGWSGDVFPRTLELGPGGTASASASVTSDPAAAPGSYGLAVNVSDPESSIHSASVAGWYQVADDTALDTTPPTAPSRLRASIKRKHIGLVWIASTDDVGVSAYTVWRDGLAIGTASGTSYVDRAVRPGVTYTYWVVARDAAGNASEPSDTLSVTHSSGLGKDRTK